MRKVALQAGNVAWRVRIIVSPMRKVGCVVRKVS